MLLHADLLWVRAGYIGPDMFFVVSGFLITGHIVSGIERKGRVDLVTFFARRASRLLPAAAAVTIVTTLVLPIFFPVTQWQRASGDSVASSLYFQNWRLAAVSTDYLGSHAAAGPLQHYWTLAVEEQFYFIWPLAVIVVTAIAARLARNNPLRVRIAVGALAATTIVCSLTYSYFYTASSPNAAYFVTPARMWEMSAGALLSVLTLPKLLSDRRVAAVLSWGAVAVLIALVYVYPRETSYPGLKATVPVLMTVTLLAVGQAAPGAGAANALSVRPLTWLGDVSYSVYLWHWPILMVLLRMVQRHDPQASSLPQWMAILALLVTLGIGQLSYQYLEQPARRSKLLNAKPQLALAMGGALTVVGVVTGLAVHQLVDHKISTGEARLASVKVPAGAGALITKSAHPYKLSGEVYPAPVLIAAQWSSCGTTPETGSWVSKCIGGDTKATREIAVVGDSHMKQWLDAVNEIGARHGWKVVAYIHDSCPFNSATLVRADLQNSGKRYTECTTWNRAVTKDLLADKNLKTVVTSSFGESATSTTGEKGMTQGYLRLWQKLKAGGLNIRVIGDTPDPKYGVPDCIAANSSDPTPCRVRASDALDNKHEVLTDAARSSSAVTFFDPTPYICPGKYCYAVIGNMAVYVDNGHITSTYAKSMAAKLTPAILTPSR